MSHARLATAPDSLDPWNGRKDGSLGSFNGIVQSVCKSVQHRPQVRQLPRFDRICRSECIDVRGLPPCVHLALEQSNLRNYLLHLGFCIHNRKANRNVEHCLQLLFRCLVIAVLQGVTNARYSVELRPQLIQSFHEGCKGDLRSEMRPTALPTIRQKYGEERCERSRPTTECPHPVRPSRPSIPVGRAGLAQQPTLCSRIEKILDPIKHVASSPSVLEPILP